jgi:uncharacterized protein DUF6582
MATAKQKEAARRNIKKAQSTRRKGGKGSKSTGLSTAQKNDLPRKDFAFPEERKEPLVDAKHVRNAIARFDQVEGVTDSERDQAWKRIRKAAKRFDVEVSEKSWHELFEGGKAKKKPAKNKPAKKKPAKKKPAKKKSAKKSAGR